MLVIPAGFDQRVGEAEVDEVLDRLLAEIVVDAEDGLLGKVGVERAVQLLGRGEVAAERLLDDDAGVLDAARFRQPFDDGGEHAGRNDQVVQRPLGGAEGLAQLRKRRRVAVIAVDVIQQGAKLRVRRRVQAAVLFEAVLGPRFELIERPFGPTHADDRHVEMAAPDHRLQGRKDLLVRQVAGGAEEDERIRTGGSHQAPPFGSSSTVISHFGRLSPRFSGDL